MPVAPVHRCHRGSTHRESQIPTPDTIGIFPVYLIQSRRKKGGITVTERGKVHSGSIVLNEPIDLPEGTEVVVRIEPVVHEQASAVNGNEFENLPFFGMWADRDEMTDSVAWVGKEREKWQQRLTQQR